MGYRENWFKENKSDHGWYTCVRCGKKIRKSDVDLEFAVHVQALQPLKASERWL